MGGIFLGFDFRNIRDPQQRLDLFMEQHRNEAIDSGSDLVTDLFFGDTTETKSQLERWKKRHPNDFEVVGRTKEGETLKVYWHGRDATQEVAHDNFLKKKELEKKRQAERRLYS